LLQTLGSAEKYNKGRRFANQPCPTACINMINLLHYQTSFLKEYEEYDGLIAVLSSRYFLLRGHLFVSVGVIKFYFFDES